MVESIIPKAIAITYKKSTHLNHFIAIIDANGGDEFGGKDILIKAQHERRLATGRVTNHEQSYNVRALGAHLQRAALSILRFGHDGMPTATRNIRTN